MDRDIWYNIGIQLDYETLTNLCLITKMVSLICTSNYFWFLKCQNDFGAEENEFDRLVTELKKGREVYIYYAGINNIPIRGSERYGNLSDLLSAAAKIGDIQLIKYFYKLRNDISVFEILGNQNKGDLIYWLHNKYPIEGDLFYALSGAIKADHKELIARLSEEDALDNLRGQIIQIAASTGKIVLFKYVADYFSVEDEYEYRYLDLLEIACSAGKASLVAYLLAKGLTQYNGGLKGAAKSGDQELIEVMIALGARDYDEALRGASHGGHLSTVIDMINRGATQLSWAFIGAAGNGHIEIMKYVDGLVDLSSIYEIALQSAVVCGQIEVVKFLLTKYKPQINYVPIYHQKNGEEIFDILFPYIPPNLYQHALLNAAIHGQLIIFKKLVNAGANPSDPEIMKEAIKGDNLNIILELVRLGINYKDHSGINPKFIPYLE